MAGGRPTEYSQDIVDMAKEYLDKWSDGDDVIPSIEGLAAYIDRARSTIYFWAEQEDKKEFLDTLDRINELQKRTLINKGLTGDFNSNITRLALGNHGMSEKNQTELSGPEGKPIQTTSVINFIPVSSKDKT